MKILLCCGMSKPYLNYDSINKKFFLSKEKKENCCNGKVLATAECNKSELFDIEYYPPNSKGADCYQDLRQIYPTYDRDYDAWDYDIIYSNDQDKENPTATRLFKNGLTTFEKLGMFVTKGKYNPSFVNEFYGLYLSNVHIFDNAMSVNEVGNLSLPSNMSYCESKTNERCVLMTVNAVDLCEILNGNKTIEFRKLVLKPLKDLAFN